METPMITGLVALPVKLLDVRSNPDIKAQPTPFIREMIIKSLPEMRRP
jgi:hypothetical protein